MGFAVFLPLAFVHFAPLAIEHDKSPTGRYPALHVFFEEAALTEQFTFHPMFPGAMTPARIESYSDRYLYELSVDPDLSFRRNSTIPGWAEDKAGSRKAGRKEI